MTKTAEELYEERLEAATHGLVVEFLERAVDVLEVSDYLDDANIFGDDDFIQDVLDSVNGELDTILQRWLDD